MRPPVGFYPDYLGGAEKYASDRIEALSSNEEEVYRKPLPTEGYTQFLLGVSCRRGASSSLVAEPFCLVS